MNRGIAFDDAVYGHIATDAKDLEDFVIRKADGFPTFHLAVVVDDIDMGVTHVIRGQEHLTNTAKHAALYDALGQPRPVWCHTPQHHEPRRLEDEQAGQGESGSAGGARRRLGRPPDPSMGSATPRFWPNRTTTWTSRWRSRKAMGSSCPRSTSPTSVAAGTCRRCC